MIGRAAHNRPFLEQIRVSRATVGDAVVSLVFGLPGVLLLAGGEAVPSVTLILSGVVGLGEKGQAGPYDAIDAGWDRTLA
jgi:hypothetical protein